MYNIKTFKTLLCTQILTGRISKSQTHFVTQSQDTSI